MEITELKQQIKTGKLDKWYIFNVVESVTASIYIHKMAAVGDFIISFPDTISDIYSSISQKSLISMPTLYVLINDKDFLTNEKAWSAFEDDQNLKDDIVIFYYTNKDGRLKFWKNFQNRVVDFEKFDERTLIKYIHRHIDLSEDNCRLLIDACDGDYNQILLEIDKIKHYSKGFAGDYGADNFFSMLLSQGVIYQSPKDAIFDFVNAVLERDPEKSWNLLSQSYEVGEANLVLLSVLYDNMKHLLQIQSARGKTGLNGWIVKNLSQYRNNYSNGELVRAMKLIKEASDGIKTGRVSDDISVEQILVRIM